MIYNLRYPFLHKKRKKPGTCYHDARQLIKLVTDGRLFCDDDDEDEDDEDRNRPVDEVPVKPNDIPLDFDGNSVLLLSSLSLPILFRDRRCGLRSTMPGPRWCWFVVLSFSMPTKTHNMMVGSIPGIVLHSHEVSVSSNTEHLLSPWFGEDTSIVRRCVLLYFRSTTRTE